MSILPNRALRYGVLALIAVGAFAACTDDYPNYSARALAKTRYIATLIGANEVPAVTTTGAGTATIVQEDSNTILYTIATTATTDSVTMVHIHAGGAGANGPVMLWFFPNDLARAPGAATGFAASVNGVVRVSRITRASAFFVAPFTWDSLVTRIRNGTSYVNLHTRRNPGGEIRGQVVPAP